MWFKFSGRSRSLPSLKKVGQKDEIVIVPTKRQEASPSPTVTEQYTLHLL